MNAPVVIVAPPGDGAAVADPAMGEAAVEIAEIEAGRDVTIAEIQAETAETAIEAQTQEDETWLREELAGLRASQEATAENLQNANLSLTTQAEQIAALAETMAELSSRLTPPPPLPAEPEALEPEEALPASAADQPALDGAASPAERRPRRQWL